MTCHRFHELRSLRAAVRRFEDGSETAALIAAHEADQRMIENLKADNTRISAELLEVKHENRILKEKVSNIQSKYDLLVSKYSALRNESDYETVINSPEFQERIDHLVLSLFNELEDKQAYIVKLESQIHKDYTNSSKPSSQCPNHKKIVNNREKTGASVGGQPGHKGHPRKQREATKTMALPFPEEVISHPDDYEFVEFKSRKQTDVRMEVTVTELKSPVFRNKQTGRLIWTPFPEGYENEMNYGAGLRAFCCMANNYLNVPLRKVSAFLKDLTHGDIEIAPSTIQNLSKRFAEKTEKNEEVIFRNLMNSPYMHNDFTTIRVNGSQYFANVSSNGRDVLYLFRKNKGGRGLEGTPVENYLFALIHDHDITYFKYGSAHQKCIVHEQRYVKGSEENEPDLKWNKRMSEHLRWIIHNFKEGNLSTEESIQKAKARYYEILDLAMEEYEHVPKKQLEYYKDGYNTAKRLKEYGESLLYFLDHPEIPYDNNECERRARRIKGKQRVIGTFRSIQSAEDYLKFMTYMETARDSTDNKFEKLVEVFS